MRKPSKHTYCLLCPILVLVGLMIGAIIVPEPVARVSAQVGGSNWSVTGSLNQARYAHTATLLRNGKVLVVGGFRYDEEGPLKSAELYDPATGKWTETGSLNAQRFEHTATLLADGKVLVTGGHSDPIANRMTAELYDPISETWSFTDNLSVSYLGRHKAVLLPNGKVFIRKYDATDTYDPATRTWRYQQINSPRFRDEHTTTVLADGRVLVAGGGEYDETIDEFRFDVSAELYDQTTGAQSFTGNLLRPRSSHTATLLHTGQVLVMSGRPGPDSVKSRSAELYDPVTGTWRDTGKLPESFFGSATTTLLADGKVMVTGFDYNLAPNRIHLYNAATEIWSIGGNLTSLRTGYTATLLPSGKVLFAGGRLNDTALNLAELYDPALPPVRTIVSVSAASFDNTGLASDAIISAFGTDLATGTSTAVALPLPTQLAGTTVKVKDSVATERLAPLFFVSSTQVNYLIPQGTAAGLAFVTITSADGKASIGIALVKKIAPGLFAANANGQGVAAAVVQRVKADGSQSYEPVTQVDAVQNKFVAHPLDLGPAGEQVYLVLFGTGLRHRRSLSAVIARIGGTYGEVSYAGAQPDFVGVDQVNVLLPRSLVGRGEVEVLLTVEAQMANPVRISIK